MVSERGTMYILYKTSDDRHRKSYEEVIEIFKKEDFIFIEENNFREQLLCICKKSIAKTIGLFVDDMIFIKNINYKKIVNINTLDYVVSLSRGKDMDYSIVLKKKLIMPEFTKYDDEFLCFRWDYSQVFSDWTYPIGVSGYFYGRDELVVMLHSTLFKMPNSLESNLQKFKPMFINRFGMCLEQISCVCIHANIVQTECINPVLGTFTIEDLLVNWESGFMIDLKHFFGITGAAAQFQDYQFIKR